MMQCKLINLQFSNMAKRLQDIKGKIVSDPIKYLDLHSLIPNHHKALLQKIQLFGEKHLRTQLMHDCDEQAIFPDHIISPLQQLDIGKYFIAAPYGQQLPLVTQGLIIATFAQFDLAVSTFLFLQLPLSARTIYKLGSQEQKKKYLKDMIALKKICGWALTEKQVGSNSTRIGTTYVKNPTGFVLNGNKRWIGNGNKDLLIVYGNLKEESSKNNIVGAIVEVNSKGLKSQKIENKFAFRIVQNCQIEFENVQVPSANLLPGANNYRQGVQKVLKHSRIIVIWNAVGGCIGVYKNVIKYATERHQFGRSISGFQLVQEKIVRMMGNLQAVLLATWRITELYEKDNELSTAKIGMFKAWVTERARLICALGREIMGGNGLLQQNYVMKALVDMEVLYTYEGTYDINALVAGSELTGLKAFT